MTARKPLVRVNGQVVQLPVTDVIIPNQRAVLNAATDVPLSTATSEYVQISMPGGGQPITIETFGDALSGMEKTVYFANVFGGMTLRNWGRLVLPTGANISVAVGDTAIFRSDGNNAWRCIAYQRADGTALVGSGGSATDPTKLALDGSNKMTGAVNEAPYAQLAAASTLDLSARTANTYRVTGSAAVSFINAGASALGLRRTLWFNGDGAVLTHNTSRLLLPGGVSITTRANDCAEFVCIGSGTEQQWLCVDYQRGDGTSLVGSGGGSQTTFDWDQSSALSTWTIPHNLNRHPSVTLVDSTGARVWTDVFYVDSNVVQVTFATPTAGKAYLN